MKLLVICALVAIPTLVPAAPHADVSPTPYQAAAPRSVEARVVALQLQGDHAVVTLSAGSDQGVGREWTAAVLKGTTQQPLAGGEMTIIRIDAKRCVGRVKLTAEQVAANPRVRLSPPNP